MNLRYFVIFLVLIGSSGFAVSQASGAYVEFDNGKDKLLVNNKHIVDFQLDWGSGDFPSGKITFDEPANETILIQIPKSIPRITNLDFGHFGLHAIQTDGSWIQIKETESECFYILEIPVRDSDYVEIVGTSVAAGRWEPVSILNHACGEFSLRQQIENKMSMSEIKCKGGLELVGKMPSADPKCVKPESVEELVMRGWATTNKTLELTNPITYIVDKNKHTFEIQYSLKGATLESIFHDIDANSVHVELNNVVGGQMVISIPRDLLDAKIGSNNADDVFFLLIDGEENMYGEKITDDERIITVWFPKDTNHIEIIGTFWI